MRKQYWQLALSRLGEGRMTWLMEQGWKSLAVRMGAHLGRPLSGPILGSILVTYRCDNLCLMCDYPQQAVARKKGGDTELSPEELQTVVEDFHRIGSSSVSFTGGEPMLRPDVLNLLRRGRELGMLTNINSNANLLHKEDLCRELLETRLDLINFSLDGAEAATHDHLRGVKGGHAKLVEAVGHIRELKARHGYKTLLNLVTVISPRNLPEIPKLLELARSWGVNRIGFMPLHAFDFQKEDLKASPEQWLGELDAVVQLLQESRDIVDSSVEYLALFRDAFLGRPLPFSCKASYSSLMVNTYGEVFPCFPWIERRKSVGNVRQTPLREFWASKTYNEKRREVDACRDCHWNCHTELNLALR